MKPVPRRDLAVLALGLGLAAWLLVREYYGHLPPLDWWLPAPLGVLAVVEAFGARTLARRLAQLRAARAGKAAPATKGSAAPVRPLEPMLVARMAVLAQASAYVGAVLLGAWAGVLVHVAPAVGRLQAAGDDTVTAVIGVVCAAALVGAALWLESVCRIPPEEHDAMASPSSG